MAKKSTQLPGLISQDLLFDEPGTGVTTESSGKWSTGRISGRMIRKVGPHPGVANVSGGEQSASPSEEPRVRTGGDFGKGPALKKNRSGSGYHVKGAPGFEDD